MTETLSNIPRGMRYYFGPEARVRRAAEECAMSVFDGWSYEEIVPPSVDYYALFERGMGRAEAKLAFRFTDADGRMLALRPDITSSVARAAATLFAERARPLRLCYAAPVFRQKARTHAEWRRESAQIGCELIGASESLAADFEIIAVALEILEKLGMGANGKRFCVTLNDVEVFNGVAEGLRLDAEARERMRQLIDRREASELCRFLQPYASSDERESFARLIQLSGKRETLESARRLITNARSVAALERLTEIWRVVESLRLTNLFEIDFGDVSGLDYYTGLTFKIYLSGAGARVGGGGRYDNLTSNFGRAERAVGFVLDLDALTDLLTRDETRARERDEERGASRVNGGGDDGDAASLFSEIKTLRARGERVLIESNGVTS